MPVEDAPLSTFEALFEQLAPRVGGTFARNEAVHWFDGFWDFFASARAALEREPSCQVEGLTDALGWLLLCRERPRLQLDVFVEVRPPPSGKNAPRPHDVELAATLRKTGFDVEIGKWGAQVTAQEPARVLSGGLPALEALLSAALRLGKSIAEAEKYLPGYNPR